MWYISKNEFENRMKQLKAKNKSKELKQLLKAEKRKFAPKFKMPSTSKLILLGAVLLCLEIVIFCEYVMIRFGDTSAMYVLVGIPATLIPIIWGYYSKAKAENTKGGITYDMAMMENENANSQNENMSGNDAVG